MSSTAANHTDTKSSESLETDTDVFIQRLQACCAQYKDAKDSLNEKQRARDEALRHLRSWIIAKLPSDVFTCEVEDQTIVIRYGYRVYGVRIEQSSKHGLVMRMGRSPRTDNDNAPLWVADPKDVEEQTRVCMLVPKDLNNALIRLYNLSGRPIPIGIATPGSKPVSPLPSPKMSSASAKAVSKPEPLVAAAASAPVAAASATASESVPAPEKSDGDGDGGDESVRTIDGMTDDEKKHFDALFDERFPPSRYRFKKDSSPCLYANKHPKEGVKEEFFVVSRGVPLPLVIRYTSSTPKDLTIDPASSVDIDTAIGKFVYEQKEWDHKTQIGIGLIISGTKTARTIVPTHFVTLFREYRTNNAGAAAGTGASEPSLVRETVLYPFSGRLILNAVLYGSPIESSIVNACIPVNATGAITAEHRGTLFFPLLPPNLYFNTYHKFWDVKQVEDAKSQMHKPRFEVPCDNLDRAGYNEALTVVFKGKNFIKEKAKKERKTPSKKRKAEPKPSPVKPKQDKKNGTGKSQQKDDDTESETEDGAAADAADDEADGDGGEEEDQAAVKPRPRKYRKTKKEAKEPSAAAADDDGDDELAVSVADYAAKLADVAAGELPSGAGKTGKINNLSDIALGRISDDLAVRDSKTLMMDVYANAKRNLTAHAVYALFCAQLDKATGFEQRAIHDQAKEFGGLSLYYHQKVRPLSYTLPVTPEQYHNILRVLPDDSKPAWIRAVMSAMTIVGNVKPSEFARAAVATAAVGSDTPATSSSTDTAPSPESASASGAAADSGDANDAAAEPLPATAMTDDS